jgi:hypothetical protein
MANTVQRVRSARPVDRIEVRRRSHLSGRPGGPANRDGRLWQLRTVAKDRRRNAAEILALVALTLAFFAACTLTAFGGVAAARAASKSVTLPVGFDLHASQQRSNG